MRDQVGAVVAVVVLAGVATGCGDDAPAAGPFYEEVVSESERMRVEPEVASPGDMVELYFPQGDERGPGFVLERRADDQWVWEWVVSSGARTVISAEEFRQKDVEWVSGPSFSGEGPHSIPIPEGSEGGEYRVCTAPDAPYCAPFRISDG